MRTLNKVIEFQQEASNALFTKAQALAITMQLLELERRQPENTPEEAAVLERMVRSCAQKCVDMIRREQIEPQSPLAYHVFATASKTMYRIGAALELKRLGYKFEKMDLPSC